MLARLCEVYGDLAHNIGGKYLRRSNVTARVGGCDRSLSQEGGSYRRQR